MNETNIIINDIIEYDNDYNSQINIKNRNDMIKKMLDNNEIVIQHN